VTVNGQEGIVPRVQCSLRGDIRRVKWRGLEGKYG
jgi:hypothetical protein